MEKTKKASLGLSDKTSDIFLVVITALVLFIVAYPLYYVLVASFSDPYDVYAGKTFLLPSGLTLRGYAAVFADENIPTGYLNSIKYTIIGTIFSVVISYFSTFRGARPRVNNHASSSGMFRIVSADLFALTEIYLAVSTSCPPR